MVILLPEAASFNIKILKQSNKLKKKFTNKRIKFTIVKFVALSLLSRHMTISKELWVWSNKRSTSFKWHVHMSLQLIFGKIWHSPLKSKAWEDSLRCWFSYFVWCLPINGNLPCISKVLTLRSLKKLIVDSSKKDWQVKQAVNKRLITNCSSMLSMLGLTSTKMKTKPRSSLMDRLDASVMISTRKLGFKLPKSFMQRSLIPSQHSLY